MLALGDTPTPQAAVTWEEGRVDFVPANQISEVAGAARQLGAAREFVRALPAWVHGVMVPRVAFSSHLRSGKAWLDRELPPLPRRAIEGTRRKTQPQVQT